MASGRTRDINELRAGLERWLQAAPEQVPHADGRQLKIADLHHATSGLANETVLIDLVGPHQGLAIRLPPLEPSFATYDLSTQAAVQNALAGAGIPAPAPSICVHDLQWIGVPFLAMPRLQGRIPGPAPLFDRWIMGASPEEQRRLHDGLIELLALLHSIDVSSLDLPKEIPGPDLPAALEFWSNYIEWAGDGQPLPALTQAMSWCRSRYPSVAPSQNMPALVWGDPRLGNLVCTDDFWVSGVLDWELAAVGPPEMDLGWYFGLDAMMEELFGRRVPGFPERSEALALYESRSGRTVRDLEWHEIFALTRAVAINDRQQRVAAASGTRYVGGAPAVDPSSDPLANVLLARIEATG